MFRMNVVDQRLWRQIRWPPREPGTPKFISSGGGKTFAAQFESYLGVRPASLEEIVADRQRTARHSDTWVYFRSTVLTSPADHQPLPKQAQGARIIDNRSLKACGFFLPEGGDAA